MISIIVGNYGDVLVLPILESAKPNIFSKQKDGYHLATVFLIAVIYSHR